MIKQLITYLLFIFVSGMQSSLNRGVGSSAVAVVYTSFVLSSVVLPPLAIGKLDCRKTLALGMFTYALYTLGKLFNMPRLRFVMKLQYLHTFVFVNVTAL